MKRKSKKKEKTTIEVLNWEIVVCQQKRIFFFFFFLGNVIHSKIGEGSVQFDKVLWNFTHEQFYWWFFSTGDPAQLMQFMVNHPDMVTIDPSEIKAKQKMMSEIYLSSYYACIAGDNGNYRPGMEDHIIDWNFRCYNFQSACSCAHSFGWETSSTVRIGNENFLTWIFLLRLHIMFTMPWSP